MEGESQGETGDPPSNRYGTVSAPDCPVIFPYYVEQFYDMMCGFPSMLSGTLEESLHRFTDPANANNLLVMVDFTNLRVVAGISYFLHPRAATLYVCYMITDPHYRGKGFMKKLFADMKKAAVRQYPTYYKQGFNAILTETRAFPDTEYNDYFSCWASIQKTHTALNKIGFYELCFNYVMFGSRMLNGLMEDSSHDFLILVHKDSKAITPSSQANFKLQIDPWFIESLLYVFLREEQATYSDIPANLGEQFLAVLAAVPLDPCPIRQQLPFYRTDKLFPDHYG